MMIDDLKQETASRMNKSLAALDVDMSGGKELYLDHLEVVTDQ